MKTWLLILVLTLAATAARAEDDNETLQKRNAALRARLAEAQSLNKEKLEKKAAKEKFDREGADDTRAQFARMAASFARAEDGVAKMCGDPTGNFEFGAAGKLSTGLAAGLSPGYARIMAGNYSQNFNQSYPGSSIDCWQGQGVYVAEDGTHYIFSNTTVTRATNNRTANGLTYEATQGGYQLRLSDLSGNYVVISDGRGFTDAKLPITLQTSGAIVADRKGVTIGGNELIQALNKVYATLKPEGGHFLSMQSIAAELLLSQTGREAFVERYKHLKPQPAAN